MGATEPQPGNFTLSVVCPIVRLGICVGSSRPGAQKVEGAKVPLPLARNIGEFFLDSAQ